MNWWGHVSKHPLWSAVIAGLILSGMGWLWLERDWWWPSIATHAGFAWNFLFRTAELPYWLVALLLIPATLVVFVVVLAVVESRKTVERPPSSDDYTTDVFFNIRWRWNYRSYDLRPIAYCTACGVQLRPANVGGFAAAPRTQFACTDAVGCGANLHTFESDLQTVEEDVARLVQRNLNTGRWLERLQTQKNLNQQHS